MTKYLELDFRYVSVICAGNAYRQLDVKIYETKATVTHASKRERFIYRTTQHKQYISKYELRRHKKIVIST